MSVDEFKPIELSLIRAIAGIFTGSAVIVYQATARQIEQLKEAGVSGVSRKQRITRNGGES